MLALGSVTLVLSNLPQVSSNVATPLRLLTLPLLGFGALLHVRSKKLFAKINAGAALKSDSRPPVVYLRSFKQESELSDRLGTQRWLSPAGAFATLRTQEERLVEVLSSIGPVVALGQPGETLPELGAVRLYATADGWQKTVEELLQKAAVIVVRGGFSDGLKWEWSRIRAKCQPTKVLLTLPLEPEYNDFRIWASQTLPEPLPDKRSKADFIIFDANWVPVPLMTRSHVLSGLQTGPGQIIGALEPFFAASGYRLPQRPRQIRLVRILVLFFLTLLVSVGLATLVVLMNQ